MANGLCVPTVEARVLVLCNALRWLMACGRQSSCFCGLANGLVLPTKRQGSCCGRRSSGLACGLLPTLRSKGLVERAEHKVWQIACLLFLFCRGLRSWVFRSSACSLNTQLRSARSVRPCGFVGSLANYRRLLFLRFLWFLLFLLFSVAWPMA